MSLLMSAGVELVQQYIDSLSEVHSERVRAIRNLYLDAQSASFTVFPGFMKLAWVIRK